MAMRGTAALSTAWQRRQDRGQSWAAGTMYAKSMGGRGNRYPQQSRGPGTSTAASNYAKLAPARGAWSCLPPPLLLAASSCSLFVRARFPLAFLPCPHPSTPAVHPPCFPLVVSPASTESASCGLLERHGHTYDNKYILSFCSASRSTCFHRALALGSYPCHASDSLCELSLQAPAAATHNHLCLLAHPDPETVARRQPQYRYRSHSAGNSGPTQQISLYIEHTWKGLPAANQPPRSRSLSYLQRLDRIPGRRPLRA